MAGRDDKITSTSTKSTVSSSSILGRTAVTNARFAVEIFDGVIKVNANQEHIELPEESDSEDDEKVKITQKDVPSAVFGGLAVKRVEIEKDKADKDGEGPFGALARIKRQRL